jgi:alpha-tubulin suppressor-like RCC1 family protein
MALAGVQNNITLLLPQKISRLEPSSLTPDNRVTAISAGNFHTMALTVGGSILAFGANETGCLGLGDSDDRWKPTKVNLYLDGEDKVCIRAVQLACGAGHTIALVSCRGCLQVRTTGESLSNFIFKITVWMHFMMDRLNLNSQML